MIMNIRKMALTAGLLLSVITVSSQGLSSAYQPGVTQDGVAYWLPKTMITVTVTAQKQTFKPGEFSRYAERYLRLSDVKDKAEEVWTITDVRISTAGVPDKDNLYTLDSTGALVLTIMATLAEEESRNKSVIMNWSIDRRFSRGIFLTPELLGYDRDENGELVINPQEAETVKVIYDLFVNGWSATEIAELLTQYGRATKTGNTEWSASSIAGIIGNERHCGDILARKTYTPNFKNHKAKKNEGKRTQYRQRDHHEAIVSREVYNAANHLAASRTYGSKRKPLPVLSVIDGGMLAGYVPVDKDWKGFSTEDYRAACESVDQKEESVLPTGKRLNMAGFQIVRSDFFPSTEDLKMTISQGNLRFSTSWRLICK